MASVARCIDAGRGAAERRLTALALLIGVATTLGYAVTHIKPIAAVALGFAGASVVWFIVRFRVAGPLIMLLLVITLFPVVASPNGEPSTIGGYDAQTLRTIATVALTVLALGAVGNRLFSSLPRAAWRIVVVLFALGLLGGVAALFAAYPDPKGVFDDLSHAGGQPIIYALVFAAFVSLLEASPQCRDTLLTAWCWCILLEALIVAAQFATGAAYDPVLHYTRAFGSNGSDSLGAFSLMGAFAALYLRITTSSRSTRRLATIAAVASVAMMLSAITRTSVIGFGLALTVLVVGGLRDSNSRRRLGAVAVIAVLFGCTLFALQGLWSSRLESHATQTFDRPATWVSGIRMAEANPLTGTGSTSGQFLEALQTNYNYSDTGFGTNASVPHNAWIDAFAGDGVPYGMLFLALTWLFVSAVRSAWRDPRKRYLLAVVVGGGLSYLVNTMFYHLEITILMLLAAALILEPERTEGPATHSTQTCGS